MVQENCRRRQGRSNNPRRNQEFSTSQSTGIFQPDSIYSEIDPIAANSKVCSHNSTKNRRNGRSYFNRNQEFSGKDQTLGAAGNHRCASSVEQCPRAQTSIDNGDVQQRRNISLKRFEMVDLN